MTLPTDPVAAAELAPSLLGPTLRVIGALALLAAGAWILLGRLNRGRRGRGDLCVIDRAFLARGAGVALVRVEGRRLLLGVSNDGVRLLSDLERPRVTGERGSFDAFLLDAETDEEAAS